MPPKKPQRNRILLLVFIHGFNGGDFTFEGFPRHLHGLLRTALPNFSVLTLNYPRYETRGDLQETVVAFREWLQNKVIDLEVANGTPSPTVDPSVRTILIGHSMGGIVAAETVLSILAERPIPRNDSSNNTTNATANDTPMPSRPSTPRRTSSRPAMPSRTASNVSLNSTRSAGTPAFMFPYIQGIVAFDTPYLGISPGVVAHEAEGQWNSINSAYGAYNAVSGLFNFGGAAETSQSVIDPSRALPAPTSPTAHMGSAAITNPDGDAAATPLWQRWGRYAMFAGAAGAVAAGGAAAAYWNRDTLSSGLNWAVSHLEFVGCLTRGEELQQRVNKILQLGRDRGIGFANFYTTLGPNAGARPQDSSGAGPIVPSDQRTFVVVPKEKSEARKFWVRCTNNRAPSEVWAHTGMFNPRENPGYNSVAERAKKVIVMIANGEWAQEVYKSTVTMAETTKA